MKSLFSSPLTPDELYWAGILHADGTIDRARMRIRLVQKDRHMLEEFLKFLDQDSKISHTARQYGFGWSEGYYATSRRGVAELLALGVKGEPVPELYASRHFWRGLIDGDGSVYTQKDGRKPQVWLCSAKPRDIAAFSEWVGKLFDYQGPKPCQGKTAWYAAVSHGKGRALAVYLYKNSYSAVPFKRDIALSFEAMVLKTATDLLTQEP